MGRLSVAVAVASITTPLCVILAGLLWQSRQNDHESSKTNRPKPKICMAPRPKAMTYRISNIPSAITQDSFKASLATFIEDPARLHPGLVLLGCSYVPAAYSDRYMVATVDLSISIDPSELQSFLQEHLEYKAEQLEVDIDFFGLTPLANSGHTDVDIIAVTGLAGHGFGSWKAREGSQMWLRDFLPDFLPQARIFTYSYDTRLPGSQSNASVSDLAKGLLEHIKIARRHSRESARPLILIGHSLGGLVVKEALLKALRGSVEDQNISRSCYGIMFFGVPHRGLNIDGLRAMVKGQPNEELVRNISPSAHYLQILDESFQDSFPDDSRIISFCETKLSPTVEWSTEKGQWQRTGPHQLLVSPQSAFRAANAEKTQDQHKINRDHSDMVKFKSASDPDFLVVARNLSHLAHESHTVIGERFGKLTKTLTEIERTILKALQAPNSAVLKADVIESPAHNTLKWVATDQMISSWRSSSQSSLLWIRGSLGQGKSVLAKYLVEELQSNTNASSQLLYFFFYSQDDRFRSTDALLRSFIKQAITRINLASVLDDLCEIELTSASTWELWSLFNRLVSNSSLKQVTCIIDAFDECEDKDSRKLLLNQLTGLLKDANVQWKILITSRPAGDISAALYRFPHFELQAASEDLIALINQRVVALPFLDDALCQYATDLLLHGAGRTFLWITMVLRKMERMTVPTREGLGDIVKDTPTEIKDLYEKVVSQVMQSSKKEQELLAWVVYARRPMSLRELESALATSPSTKSWNDTASSRTHLTKELILATSIGPLLEITNDGIVHLFHQSAKEFLLETSQLDGLRSQQYLASTCVTYLGFEDFASGSCEGAKDLDLRRQKYTLLDYAARHWHLHIRNKDEAALLQQAITKIIHPGSSYLLAWAEAAGLHHVTATSDKWGIAVETGIPWLMRFSTDAVSLLTKQDVERAAEKVIGYDILEKHIQDPKTQLTQDAVIALIQHFDDGLLRILFDKSALEVTKEMLQAALQNKIAAVPITRSILRHCKNLQLTSQIVKLLPQTEHLSPVTELFLRHDSLKITSGAWLSLFGLHSIDTIEFALKVTPKDDLKVTETLLEHSVYNETQHVVKILQILAKRAPDTLQPTSKTWEKAATTRTTEMMQTLLNEFSDRSWITQEVLVCALRNIHCGDKMLRVILDKCYPDLIISNYVVAAIHGCPSMEPIIRVISNYPGTVELGEDAWKAIIASVDSARMLSHLLNRTEVEVTEDLIRLIFEASLFIDSCIAVLREKRSREMKHWELFVSLLMAARSSPAKGLRQDREYSTTSLATPSSPSQQVRTYYEQPLRQQWAYYGQNIPTYYGIASARTPPEASYSAYNLQSDRLRDRLNSRLSSSAHSPRRARQIVISSK